MHHPAAHTSVGKDAEPQDPMTTGSLIDQRVHARTCELALLAGRAPSQVSQSDYEQARREISGATGA
jgi:hypothetical protein